MDDVVHVSRVLIVDAMWGILAMRVCATKDATDEEVLEEANRLNPCGTSMGWCRVYRKDERGEGGYDGPVTCADDPDRVHLILSC